MKPEDASDLTKEAARRGDLEVGLQVALLAVLLAVVGFFAGLFDGDAAQKQNALADAYGSYEAAALAQRVNNNAAAVTDSFFGSIRISPSPGASAGPSRTPNPPGYAALADTFRKTANQYGSEASGYLSGVNDLRAIRDSDAAIASGFHVAELFLQIAVLVSSLALVVAHRVRLLLWLARGLAGLGVISWAAIVLIQRT